VGADGLELADAVLLVEPRQAEGRDPAVGRLGDPVEARAVTGAGHHVPVALGDDVGRRERGPVHLYALLDVLVAADVTDDEAFGDRRIRDRLPEVAQHVRGPFLGAALEAAALECDHRRLVGLDRVRADELLADRLLLEPREDSVVAYPLVPRVYLKDEVLREREPRPRRQRAVAVLPEPDPSRVVAPDVLVAPPGEVADVARDPVAVVLPDRRDELLHAQEVAGPFVRA